ncbi:MAG: hypothetical protein AVDCRST_MAG85-3359, partial [uncultured Solirubrobacteraceae bacterium]
GSDRPCRARRRLRVPRARRRLRRQGPLPGRDERREGQPRPGRRPQGRADRGHPARRRRRGRADAGDQRQADRAAAQRHAGDAADRVAVRLGQPLRRPAHPARRRPAAEGGRRHRRLRHDLGGRDRPAVQPVRPGDPQGPQGLHPRPGQPVEGRRRAPERGLAVRQPGARLRPPPVRRAELRLQGPPGVRRELLAPGHRPGRPQGRRLAPRRRARPVHGRDRPRGGQPPDIAAAPPAVHAARELDLRRPARHTRRARPRRQREQAGHAEAPRRAARAAPVRPRGGPHRPRPVGARPQPRRGQRPHRAGQVRPAAARHHRARGRAQRQEAPGLVRAVDGVAQGSDAPLRLLPPLHGRLHRLARRLQPLGHLRRQRLGQPRRDLGQRVRRGRRPAQARPAGAARRRPRRRADGQDADEPLSRRHRAPGRGRVEPVEADEGLQLRPLPDPAGAL